MLNRAYSLLTIKAVDDERRILTGTATTPTPDRVGDVIEPLGAEFKAALPFLLYHDAARPAGEIVLSRPSSKGIDFTLTIPNVIEPGVFKDRVDEAYHTAKYLRRVMGVSIGFRGLEPPEPIGKTGGYRFKSIEIVEVSLVSVPANQDATIHTVKAFDADGPAASGRAAAVSSTRSGASDTTRNQKMNISERLTAKKAELKTKHARLEAIEAGTETEALSDALKLEAKGLVADINDLTADVERLEAIEKSQALIAKPVIARDTASGAAARDAQHQVQVKQVELPPGIEFARYVICKMAQLVSRGEVTAMDVARSRYPDQPRIQHLIKAAVTAHTTVDGANTGGQELVYATNLVSEFIEFLRPMTIIGKFGTNGIPSLRRVPFNVRILGQTSGGAGYWVGQGKQRPLKKFDFAATTLGFAKVAAISVISDELARFSSPSAEVLVRDALAGSLVERLDTDFVDPYKAVAAAVSPASITNGLVALTPSGTDAAAVRADLKQLLATFIAANINPASLVLITTNTVALTLSLMRNALGQREFPNITMTGGTLEGFPVIASQYCAAGSPVTDLLIAANASDIFLSDDGQVSIDVSREASLEMESDPENQSGTVVSMFQTDSLALRAERVINWQKRRSAAVAYLDSVAYDSGSPA